MHVVVQVFAFDFQNDHSQESFLKRIRQREYDEVFMMNTLDPYIHTFHVLCENERAYLHYMELVSSLAEKEKIRWSTLDHQPTYQEILEYIRSTIPDNELVSIMNADMYFCRPQDHELIQKHMKSDILLALTRHEETDPLHTVHTEESCPFTVYGGSGDVFIFMTPLRPGVQIELLNKKQNTFHIEAYLCSLFQQAGYRILNPCDAIYTMHRHRFRQHFHAYDDVSMMKETGQYVLNLKTPLHTFAE